MLKSMLSSRPKRFFSRKPWRESTKFTRCLSISKEYVLLHSKEEDLLFSTVHLTEVS